jgi:hypothetical protein
VVCMLKVCGLWTLSLSYSSGQATVRLIFEILGAGFRKDRMASRAACLLASGFWMLECASGHQPVPIQWPAQAVAGGRPVAGGARRQPVLTPSPGAAAACSFQGRQTGSCFCCAVCCASLLAPTVSPPSAGVLPPVSGGGFFQGTNHGDASRLVSAGRACRGAGASVRRVGARGTGDGERRHIHR